MTKILAMIDGSQYAQSVCDHVAWIAKRTETSVDLLHVIGRRDISSEPINLSGNLVLGARTALLDELAELDAQKAKVAHKRGRLLLDGAKDLLHAAGVTQIDTKLRNGDLVETVQDLQGEADLIVIGKRGEGADFAKGHLGSNLERVVRSTHKAIVIVSRAFKPIEKVLIAYDGGSTAHKAIDQVAHNPILAGLPCKVVMAATDTAENRKKIDDASVILKAAGFTVETEVVQGEPGKVISDMIERDRFDLLVMGAYSHSRLRSLFLGSTTTEMIRSCKVPVLLIR